VVDAHCHCRHNKTRGSCAPHRWPATLRLRSAFFCVIYMRDELAAERLPVAPEALAVAEPERLLPKHDAVPKVGPSCGQHLALVLRVRAVVRGGRPGRGRTSCRMAVAPSALTAEERAVVLWTSRCGGVLPAAQLDKYVAITVDVRDAGNEVRSFTTANNQVRRGCVSSARRGTTPCSRWPRWPAAASRSRSSWWQDGTSWWCAPARLLALRLTACRQWGQRDLESLTRRVFDAEYKYCTRVRIHANCRVRRPRALLTSQDLSEEEELPEGACPARQARDVMERARTTRCSACGTRCSRTTTTSCARRHARRPSSRSWALPRAKKDCEQSTARLTMLVLK